MVHVDRSLLVLRRYVSLTKPGVLFGNVITGVAGFLLAAGHLHRFSVLLFVATIGGMTLVIASACVLNNALDRDIDQLMERTRGRAVAHGDISSRRAMVFSAGLGTLGIVMLAMLSNLLVAGIGVFGFIVYVWLYGAFSKRRSPHGTIVGSISGALPIVAGYCAVTGRVDTGAALLFAALFAWQFPEFYSIAIYRQREYAAAHVPVITVAVSKTIAVRSIIGYAIVFVLSALALTPLGYTGWLYFVGMFAVNVYFLRRAFRGLGARDIDVWARSMFRTSLTVLLVYSAMLSIGALLP